MAWCRDNRIDYVPVVFPGFSWHNMHPESTAVQIPRNNGKFYWKQLVGSIHEGAEMIYVAMFDEIDEGTAIFKTTKDPPVGQQYVTRCTSFILTALTLGQKFGVIAILKQSIPRHLRYVGALGVSERLAGELPVGLRVVELSNGKKTFGRMVEVGKTLRDTHGADVVIMGCAGMARYRKPLQDEIGIPVVEPTQAAVTMAIGRVRLNWAGQQ